MPQFSLQTYTIRNYLKDPNQLSDALKQVKAMGINALEAARINFTLDEALKFKDICDRYDIRIGSSQLKFDTITKQYKEIVAIHQLWNCKFVVVSMLPLKYFFQKEKGLVTFAQKLNEVGSRLREEGLELLFHHHHFEFLKHGDRLGIELIMEHTDPKHVGLVIDTYWAQMGGKSPQHFIQQYRSRVKVVHLRDYRLKLAGLGIKPTDCEIGQGSLQFGPILEACLSSGVNYMAIEQNSKDPLVSIKTSVGTLRNLGYEKLF